MTPNDPTLPEAAWLLTHFDSQTGVRRRVSTRFGDAGAAVGCAALLELLSLDSISVSGIGTVKYARALVYPGETVPRDPALERAHRFVSAQRKPRRATWLMPRIFFALDLPSSLGAKGLVVPDATGRSVALTPSGLQKVDELTADLSGDFGANLAAVIVRGDLLGLVLPDADAATVDHLRDRSVAAPISGRLLFEALGEINNQSSAV